MTYGDLGPRARRVATTRRSDQEDVALSIINMVDRVSFNPHLFVMALTAQDSAVQHQLFELVRALLLNWANKHVCETARPEEKEICEKAFQWLDALGLIEL